MIAYSRQEPVANLVHLVCEEIWRAEHMLKVQSIRVELLDPGRCDDDTLWVLLLYYVQ